MIGTPVTISKMNEYDNSRNIGWKESIKVLDRYGLSREEFWKRPRSIH